MQAIHAMIAAVALSFVQPAQAATTDPEVLIYRFPGVFDNGGDDFIGTATLFSCTNFSGVPENIRLVTRSGTGTLVNNISVTDVAHLTTLTRSTHLTASYQGQFLNTSKVVGGTTAIAATSTNIICTAMVIDAANATPDGVALRGIRFNPAPGSQE